METANKYKKKLIERRKDSEIKKEEITRHYFGEIGGLFDELYTYGKQGFEGLSKKESTLKNIKEELEYHIGLDRRYKKSGLHLIAKHMKRIVKEYHYLIDFYDFESLRLIYRPFESISEFNETFSKNYESIAQLKKEHKGRVLHSKQLESEKRTAEYPEVAFIFVM